MCNASASISENRKDKSKKRNVGVAFHGAKATPSDKITSKSSGNSNPEGKRECHKIWWKGVICQHLKKTAIKKTFLSVCSFQIILTEIFQKATKYDETKTRKKLRRLPLHQRTRFFIYWVTEEKALMRRYKSLQRFSPIQRVTKTSFRCDVIKTSLTYAISNYFHRCHCWSFYDCENFSFSFNCTSMNSATSQFNVISSAFKAARTEFASGGSAIINRRFLYYTQFCTWSARSYLVSRTSSSAFVFRICYYSAESLDSFIGSLRIDHFAQKNVHEKFDKWHSRLSTSVHTASANCKLKCELFMLHSSNREFLSFSCFTWVVLQLCSWRKSLMRELRRKLASENEVSWIFSDHTNPSHVTTQNLFIHIELENILWDKFVSIKVGC